MVDAIQSDRSVQPQVNGYSQMTSADFTKIILSELGRQDPLAPNDTNQLIQQLANIRSIQSDMDLGERLGKLVSHDEFAAAAGLMGKRVSGVSDQYGRVDGKVMSVARTNDGAVLSLDNGVAVRFSKVDEIAEVTP